MADERLWAPWRLEYIEGPKADECIFCSKPAAGDDEASYIVRRGESCFVILNAYPYNNGHVMIAPCQHSPSIEDLDEPVLLELMMLTQRSPRSRMYAAAASVSFGLVQKMHSSGFDPCMYSRRQGAHSR